MSSAAETVREGQMPAEDPPPTAASSADDLPVTVIEPKPGWHFIDLGEIWRYHELLFFLTWRDIKVRYKQTILGALWAILQPLATMVVFTLFLGQVVNLTPAGIPYPLFVFAGLLPWMFFANSLGSAGSSVVGNQNLVTKIYFPRLMIPMSAIGAGVVDFVIAFVVLLVMMFAYSRPPGWSILLAPLLFLGLVVAALGVGILLSALTVAYRDFRYVVTFLIQLWMFATPCIYINPAILGPNGQTWLPFNPAYGLILNFRQAMLGRPFDYYSLTVSAAVAVAFLVLGCVYFRRVERSFADII